MLGLGLGLGLGLRFGFGCEKPKRDILDLVATTPTLEAISSSRIGISHTQRPEGVVASAPRGLGCVSNKLGDECHKGIKKLTSHGRRLSRFQRYPGIQVRNRLLWVGTVVSSHPAMPTMLSRRDGPRPAPGPLSTLAISFTVYICAYIHCERPGRNGDPYLILDVMPCV